MRLDHAEVYIIQRPYYILFNTITYIGLYNRVIIRVNEFTEVLSLLVLIIQHNIAGIKMATLKW